jgi:hypothetical protein
MNLLVSFLLYFITTGISEQNAEGKKVESNRVKKIKKQGVFTKYCYGN